MDHSIRDAAKLLSDLIDYRKQNVHVLRLVAACAIALMLATDVLVVRPSMRTAAESRRVAEIEADFSKAKRESFGFFTDIRTKDWDLMAERVRQRKNHNDEKNGFRSKVVYLDIPNAWYQNNFEPDFTCKHERRVGGMGYGPKWVCDPHRLVAEKNDRKCLVYSVGNNGNMQFEYGLRQMIGVGACEIHVFDNSHHFQEYRKMPGLEKNIFFHPWGLEGSEKISDSRQFMTMQETIEALGHEGRVIDIFKIDCEKCEWDTYKDWFKSGVTMNQILVEVHGTPPQVNDFFETMQQHNYVTFHKEPITMFGGKYIGYSFLKLAPSFFY